MLTADRLADLACESGTAFLGFAEKGDDLFDDGMDISIFVVHCRSSSTEPLYYEGC